MAKAKKPIHAHVPAKKQLKRIADYLWSKAVRADWAGKCAVCGHEKIEAHHLIPRNNEATRYDVLNGVALCSRHHQFCPELSPHQNAAGWMEWLLFYHPERHHWYVTNKWEQFKGTKNDWYYVEVIQGLREYVEPDDFDTLCGVRFVRWLDEQE